MLDVCDLRKSFGSRELWSQVSFSLAKGEILGLTGPSGCGKTTLLNCIGLLDRPTSGSITLNGSQVQNASGRTRRKMWRHEIGFLFQDYGLVDRLNVAGNVAIVEPHLVASSRLKNRCDEALAVVGLDGRGRDDTVHMSGGEQQRIALARIIVKRPSLILADEPTGSLDADNEQMVLGQLRQLADEGAMVVVATHSATVLRFCDRSINLGPGRVEEAENALATQGVGVPIS